MAQKQEDHRPFTGFGVVSLSRETAEEGVFLLVVYRDGALTASAYATERGAMEAALLDADDERDEDENDAGGTLEDRYARLQQRITEEGDVMEILPSPVHGG